ncbi:MAG TPA: ABC transporter permease, partial [Anaeromyxobacteraceae bacterium]|nr:ABC transporter permease [Anaeromyxobacteraceae bacterium]
LVVANVLQKKVRSAIAILAVGIGTALLLVLVGVTRGSIDEVARRIQNVGGDVIVQQAGATSFLALKSGILPERYGDRLRAVPGVAAVSPVVTWTTTFRNQFYVVYGIDPEQFSSIGGGLEMIAGRALRRPGEVVVDSRLAATARLAPGDRIELLGATFEIVGVSKEGIGARIFLLMSQLQSMLHQEERVSLFFVRCSSPAVVKETVAAIEAELPGVRGQLLEGFADQMARSMSGLEQFISAITGTTLLVSLLVVALAMYMTILEKTREIGILRSLGASRRLIVGLVVLESALLTGCGVVAGYGLTAAAVVALRARYPLLTVEITPAWILIAGAVGLASGLLGALYPAWFAARRDPVEALSWE